MEANHPPPSQLPSPQPSTTVPQLSFSQQDVFKSVKSFRRGSALGPSGVRPEHLKAVLKSPSPNKADKALQALTKVINLMIDGKVPKYVAPFLAGARLHAAKKRDGGIQPIAVGNLLRRLASKLVARVVASKAVRLLSPHQIGVGVRGGCESIVHAVEKVLEEDGPEKMVLQVDYTNAFNLANQNTTFQEVHQHFPELLSWVLTCYGSTSQLMFGDNIMPSATGFHQGDPLAGLLFSVNLYPVVEQVVVEVPNLDLNAWFLDDGTMVGAKEDLQRGVDVL